MGKASRWIRNFLMGKKEEKYKQIDGGGARGSEVESPKVKRRWSFGRKPVKAAAAAAEQHKLSASFDLTDSAKLQIQAILQTHPPTTLPLPFSDIEHAAATKIQAAFRAYLGRKALHALRGLVKLQALVRGHLVRKQTTTTLRSMHALITIQVRARIHRILMAQAQESNLPQKRPTQVGEILPKKGHVREYKDSKDMNLREMLEVLRSRSGPLDGPPRRSIEHDSRTHSSRQLSVSKRHHRYSTPNSPVDYLTTEGLGLSTSLRHHQSYSWEPNYMTKTESSRAKARSESEPKQRPKRGIRHLNKPIEPLDGRRQYRFSNSGRFNHGNLDLFG